MGAALYIVVEREIAGFDPFVNGNALAKAESKLAELACDLRVTNLMDFFSSDPDEAAAHMKDEGIDASHIALPPVTWFDADVGLATVTALVQHISDHPDALLNSDLVLSDLAEFKTVFLRLKSECVRWHLSVDY